MAWLKRKINWEYRAFSAWYITDTTCRQCTTRIPFSFLLFFANGRAFVYAKRQRARETMRFGLQCLANRLSESYRFQRIASSSIQRPKRYNEQQKRAGTACETMKIQRLRIPRKECSIRSFAPVRVYQLCDESFLYTPSVYLVCTVKISSMSNTNRVYSVRYRVG